MVFIHLVLYNSHNGKKVNQDRILVFLDKQSGSLLVGIFDGHGTDGHRVATSIRSSFLQNYIHSTQKNDANVLQSMKSALKQAEMQLVTNSTIDSKRSGCTANIGLFCRGTHGELLLQSINVGDSE